MGGIQFSQKMHLVNGYSRAAALVTVSPAARENWRPATQQNCWKNKQNKHTKTTSKTKAEYNSQNMLLQVCRLYARIKWAPNDHKLFLVSGIPSRGFYLYE